MSNTLTKTSQWGLTTGPLTSECAAMAPHPETTVFTLIKFGKRQHLEELREGKVHMRTVAYFRRAEDADGRQDRNEGLIAIYQPDRINMQFGDIPIPGSSLVSPVTIHDAGTDHLFCMTAVLDDHVRAHIERSEPAVHRRLATFAECALLVPPKPFQDRFLAAVSREGLSCVDGPVAYSEIERLHGPIHPFQKGAGYSWQQEYRFRVEGAHGEILELELGSLADLAVIVDAAEVPDMVRFTYRAA